jgi:hypothetical protein
MLNDALTNYVRETWREDGASIGQAYFSMSFRGKLELVPTLLTHNKYRLNHDDEYVKRLHALISARNLLVHPKPSSHEVDGVPHPMYGENVFFPGAEYRDLVEDFTFGAKHEYTPEQFYEALEKLEKWFFRRLHGNISKVRLLRARSET